MNNKSSDEHVVRLPETVDFEVTKNYNFLRRRVHQTIFYYIIRLPAHLVLNIYNRLFFGLKVEGRKNLFAVRMRSKKGVVIVPNHVHPFDCTFIDCVFPFKRVYYATLETNFRIPVARHLITWFGGVPIPKRIHEKKRLNDSMLLALNKNSFITVYPEGILYPYREDLRDFKNGAFRLAVQAQCPVLPVVVHFRKPKGLYRLYKRKPCITLSVLESIEPNVQAEELKAECRRRMEAVLQR